MESRERPVLYVCDPLKNTECKKRMCVHNKKAIYWGCSNTKNPAFAVLDENGEPMRAEPKGELRLPIFRDNQAGDPGDGENGLPCK